MASRWLVTGTTLNVSDSLDIVQVSFKVVAVLPKPWMSKFAELLK